MKTTTKQLSAAVIILLSILIATAATYPGTRPEKGNEKGELKKEASEAAPAEAEPQCGVTNPQIMMYLQDCPHHHTVYWVQSIPGTCNSRAGIENCGTATVYVQDGAIIGHTDASGYCGGYSSSSMSSGGENPEGPK